MFLLSVFRWLSLLLVKLLEIVVERATAIRQSLNAFFRRLAALNLSNCFEIERQKTTN